MDFFDLGFLPNYLSDGTEPKFDPGTQFACFTGTKVQIVTPVEFRGSRRDRSDAMQYSVCLLYSTKVQILTPVEPRPFLRSDLLLKLFSAQIVLVVDICLKLLVYVAF